MAEPNLCPKCGKALSADAPEGMCLRCLGELAAFVPDPAVTEKVDQEFDEFIRLRRIGDNELTDVIGQGGMGVVWRARQTSLGREVALKLIRPGMDFGLILARFLESLRLCAVEISDEAHSGLVFTTSQNAST